MEDTLWVSVTLSQRLTPIGLNPYSNGICSLRPSLRLVKLTATSLCLNPYSIGRYSMSAQRDALKDAKVPVIILILLEVTLWGILGQR